MLTSEFDYVLPPELIAQRPLARRDASRMMVVLRREGQIIHRNFLDFRDYLSRGDVLVLNTAKVIPARVWGKKEGEEIEFLFLQEREAGVWEVLCRPARKVSRGDRIIFSAGFKGDVISLEKEGKRILRFSSVNVLAELKKIGFAPLPPYIKRQKNREELRSLDLARYQTVFARKEGAVAAPTAGLHFTPRTLEEIRGKGVVVCSINLEVGEATFRPVRAEKVEDHKMLQERYTINQAAAGKINLASKQGRPVVACGTTVVRALEGAAAEPGILPGTRSTGLFIYPGYSFKVVDRLLTNFHLPRSTLLMLVSAFAGTKLMKNAYAEAVRLRYRFYSYGDCMLII